MGLSSSDSGSAPAKDVGNGPSSMNHQSFGDTLMGMIKARYPIAGAVAGAAGGGGHPGVSAPAAVPGQAPLPQFDVGDGTPQGVDPTMLQAGQIGSQHSQFSKDLLKLIGGM